MQGMVTKTWITTIKVANAAAWARTGLTVVHSEDVVGPEGDDMLPRLWPSLCCRCGCCGSRPPCKPAGDVSITGMQPRCMACRAYRA